MLEVKSQTITDKYKADSVPISEWKFQINNGNEGEKIISDVLLETEALAEERALSEFLNNSYKRNEVSFTTFRTDLVKNMIVNVSGLPYIVKNIVTNVDNTSIKSTITAVRYE